MKINIIYKDDLEFPDNLRNIYNCPEKLYVLGNIENLRKNCVSIVGCRVCSLYGKMQAERIAFKLSKQGKVIVSGLAKGIDSQAHMGALNARGRTIAVLGHGLDKIYPKFNKNLAIEILKNNGTIISEYSFEDPFLRENFIKRNRIISGISNSLIVVEARKKSGSLITANFALEQGKKIMAVPGKLSNLNSVGTNFLIRNGAEIYI